MLFFTKKKAGHSESLTHTDASPPTGKASHCTRTHTHTLRWHPCGGGRKSCKGGLSSRHCLALGQGCRGLPGGLSALACLPACRQRLLHDRTHSLSAPSNLLPHTGVPPSPHRGPTEDWEKRLPSSPEEEKKWGGGQADLQGTPGKHPQGAREPPTQQADLFLRGGVGGRAEACGVCGKGRGRKCYGGGGLYAKLEASEPRWQGAGVLDAKGHFKTW